MAGCMLYWAEGSKSRNQVHFANSDLNMVKFFCDFLRTSLGVRSEDMTLRLNVYTGNGLSLREIEAYWLNALDLPRSCSARTHTEPHAQPQVAARRGTGFLMASALSRLLNSTRLIQHIFGAIQEYAGFEEPRWLDGPPIKPRPRRKRTAATAST